MQEFAEKYEYGKRVLAYLDANYTATVFSQDREWAGQAVNISLKDFFLYRINEITFEEKAPRKEAVENILGAFRGLKGFNFIYMILGEKDHVDFYLGVAADKYFRGNSMFSPRDIAGQLLEPSIKGNFRGSRIKEVSAEDKQAILDRIGKARRFGLLEGVPGVTKESDENKEGFQGVDRLIDVMLGERFGLVVIASPCSAEDVRSIRDSLYNVYDALLPLTKYTLQKSSGKIETVSKNKSFSTGLQAGRSTQQGEANNVSEVVNKSTDSRHDRSSQNQVNNSTNHNYQHTREVNRWSSTDTESNNSSKRHENSATKELFSDETQSSGQTTNNIYSNTYSENDSYNVTSSQNNTMSSNKNKNVSRNYSRNRSSGTSTNESSNFNRLEQLEVGSKNGAFWIEYIDKILLPRLDEGCGKGLFRTCIFLFGDDNRAALYRAGNTAAALYCAEKGNQNPLSFYELPESAHGCVHALKNFQIPAALFNKKTDSAVGAALSNCLDADYIYCANWLGSNEVSVVAGLPQKEVIGLSLRKEVDFGLNIPHDVAENDKIEIGRLVQCGEEKRNITFSLNKNNLDKHMFVAGVTGSGKTTTCQNILLDCGLPFLVIEPAKTEYRILKNKCPDLIVFTLGKQDVAPFFLNPFELIPGENITSRADMLKASMEASFDMDAAIPQILEAAIYKAYEDKGWNIKDNTWMPENTAEEADPFADGVFAFPVLSDFVKAAEDIVLQQGFDDRLRDEYNGSIKARLQGLLVGSKGMMLNNRRSVDFRDLLDKKVVIELEEIKNGTEKSLIMGFILTNLLEALKYKHAENPEFQHITLVEEAHRLLSNYSPGDSMNKKQGVEVFADMLAEVRKYRESLIIVDQIPSKMTPEVLKNTNTKIVHKIFAQDDKDIIGNTMALEKEQKEFLSNLIPGRAIVFTQGLNKAIQIQVAQKTETTGIPEIKDEEISKLAVQYYHEHYRRGVLYGLEHMENASCDDVEQYMRLQRSDLFVECCSELKSECYKRRDITLNDIKINLLRRYLKKSIECCSEELFMLYFYWNISKAYSECRYQDLKSFVDLLLEEHPDENELQAIWMSVIDECREASW